LGVVLAVGLLVGGAFAARELLNVRSILGLEEAIVECAPTSVATRYPDNDASAAGRWERAQAYPVARDELRAAAVDGRIYAGTGLIERDGQFESQADLFVFDPAAGRYRRVPPVPVAVDHAAFVGHEGALYVIGGYVDHEASSAMWRFTPKTGRWDELPPMRVRRASPAAAVIGDRIYVVGGTQQERGNVGAMSALEIYEIASKSWSRGPDMPTPRHHHGAVESDGQLVVVGGRGRDDLSSDAVEQFDPARSRWSARPPLPLGSGGLAVIDASGQIVAVGGGDDAEGWVTPATWALGPGESEWRRLADLNVPRHGHGAAAVGSRVFVFGGAPCPGYGRTDAVEALRVPSREGSR
jgi:N-acetylneuraminic acid mutarotase